MSRGHEGHRRLSNIARAFGVGLAPFAVAALEFLPPIALNNAIRHTAVRPGAWVLLAILPALALEVLMSRCFEWPAARTSGARRWFWLALAARLGVITYGFAQIAGRAWWYWHEPDIVAPLIVHGPAVAWMVLRASVPLGVVAASLTLAAYVGVTVRKRRFRMTTTILLPVAFTVAFFQIFYHAPTLGLRGPASTRPAFVERVYPPQRDDDVAASMRYPRGVYVAPGERFLVATFGATFGEDRHDKPNVVWMDLATRHVSFERTDVTRRFQSECPTPIYVSPWHQENGAEQLLKLDPPSGDVRRFSLPASLNGYPIGEVNAAYHACDRHRVYLASNRNPAILVWDTRTDRIERIVNLVGAGGIVPGDSVILVTRNRTSGKLYVVMDAPYSVVEIDEDTLEVTRQIRMPQMAFDLDVAPDGAFLYVTAAWYGTIWKLDARTLRIAATFDGPLHCRRVVTSRDGRRLFAGGYFSGSVDVLDATTGERLNRVSVAPKIESLYVADRGLYVASADGIFRIPLDALQ